MNREQPDTLRSLKRRIKQEIIFLGKERGMPLPIESHIGAWKGFLMRIERMIKNNKL